MVSILLAKLAISQCVVATDGDDDTLILLQENINQSECIDKIAVEKLYWGIEEHITNISEKHLLSYNKTSFDVLIAADVVYEVEQIEPLISTACSMLSSKYLFYCLLLFIIICYHYYLSIIIYSLFVPIYIETGAFYLSFYPRNVPVDRVIECATAKGLVSVEIVHKWSIPRKGAKLEKIFKIQWRE